MANSSLINCTVVQQPPKIETDFIPDWILKSLGRIPEKWRRPFRPQLNYPLKTYVAVLKVTYDVTKIYVYELENFLLDDTRPLSGRRAEVFTEGLTDHTTMLKSDRDALQSFLGKKPEEVEYTEQEITEANKLIEDSTELLNKAIKLKVTAKLFSRKKFTEEDERHFGTRMVLRKVSSAMPLKLIEDATASTPARPAKIETEPEAGPSRIIHVAPINPPSPASSSSD